MNRKEKRFHNLNKTTKICLVLFTISVLIVVFYIIHKQSDKSMNSQSSSTNLQNHPIYSQYTYNQDDAIINIGIQPLYLPTGIIFEAIKRDSILTRTLLQLNREIRYYSFLKGADVNFFLQQGQLNGGVGGDMPALSASSMVKVLIPVRLQKGNVSIVSAKPMLTNDMEGKRIAYPFGSISHYFILELLQSAGIAETDVKLIPMEVSSMAEALYDNKIDLFSAWEPIVASAMKQYPEFFIPYRRITTGYLYFLHDFTTRNREMVSHILAAVIRAIRWLKSDREALEFACLWNIMEIERLTGEKSILTAEEIAELALKDLFQYQSLYNSIVIKKEEVRVNAALHSEYILLRALGKVPVGDNWEQVRKSFDDSLILEIFKHPKKYRLNEFDYDYDGK